MSDHEKTPGCMKISQEQRDSLFVAAMLLIQGERVIDVPNDGKWLFAMSTVATVAIEDYVGHAMDLDEVSECGTAGCIHGLVNQIEVYAGRPDTWGDEEHRGHSLRGTHSFHSPRFIGYGEPCRYLFYPNSKQWAGELRQITPRMAAIAIFQFLGGNDYPSYRQIRDGLSLADAAMDGPIV